MRLIDADAITKRMIAFCDKNCPYTPKERDVMCGACFMGAAMELLEDAPTIEPERKTGEWIPQDHNRRNGYVTTTVYFYPKCSKCGYSGNYGMDYCPSCGAYMGGEQNEAD